MVAVLLSYSRIIILELIILELIILELIINKITKKTA